MPSSESNSSSHHPDDDAQQSARGDHRDSPRGDLLIKSFVSAVYRAPYLVLIICLSLTALAAHRGYQLKDHIRTKIQDLLPDHAPSVQASRSLSERLASVDMLVLTLMTDDFERVKVIMPKLKERLERLPEVRLARWRQDTSLIERNALITFPTLEELKDAHRELSEEIKRAVREKMVLFDDEDDEEGARGVSAQGEDSAAQRFKRDFSEKLQAEEGLSYAWGELEGGESLSAIGSRLRGLSSDYPEHFHNSAYSTIGFKVFPSESSHDLTFCQRLVEVVERESRTLIEAELGEISPQGVVQRLDLGGAYVDVLKQSKQIKGDMFSSTLASFSLLALVLVFAFRSVRGLVCVLAPLMIGTLWTLGCTELFIGQLNLITVFIFAVLLGLGIDFGIHFYGRFREERARGADALTAMQNTHLSCGHASVLAACTTSAAFLALTLADFRGLSQFGGIAALGVMLCLASVFVVMPAIIFIWERWAPLKLLGYRLESPSAYQERNRGGWVNRLGGRVALIGMLVGAMGLGLAPHIERELNFNKLKAAPKPQAQLSAEELSASRVQHGTTKATSPTVVFAASAQEARMLQDQLSALADQPNSLIKSVQSLYSLIPKEQPQRIKWAKRLCRKLKRKYKLFKGDARAGAEELLKRCSPAAFTEADLPDWVVDQFTDRQGVVGGFLFVSPRGSSADGERALAFHKQMQTLKTLDGEPPMVAGRMMIWAEVLTAMQRDGALTFSVALLAVLLLLGLMERSWVGLCLVSAPLVLGLGFTVGVMVLCGIKLNFFNLLALPTLIGMGVDDGVHMHHRYRELGPRSAGYIVRTTGRAACLTTLTTSIGFASLMLTDHRGLNSLGVLSVIGMSAALFATLVILPALFNWRDRRLHPHLKLVSLFCLTALSLSLMTSCEEQTPGFGDPSGQELRDASRDVTGGRGASQDMNVTSGDETGGGVMSGDTAGVTGGARAGSGGAGDRAGDRAGAGSGGDVAGSAGMGCLTHCDCDTGLACLEGMCVASETPVYCCSRRPCPRDASCMTVLGELIQCPSSPCQSVCDCAPGLSCVDNDCVVGESLLYCCDSDECPAGGACESAEGQRGMCPQAPECQGTCDCPTGAVCSGGQCSIPSDDDDLLLCCARDCSPIMSGVSCDQEDGARDRCP